MNKKSTARGMLLLAAFLVPGCQERIEKVTPVDLRYRVEKDEFVVKADGSENVRFQVKSNEPWIVFGEKKQTWYAISPESGDVADSTYEVVIKFNENTALDDRSELINIKSDYWLGKQFKVVQRGIAFLRATESVTIGQAGGKAAFQIETNQKWSARIAEGRSWISIAGTDHGEGDVTLDLNFKENKGEVRSGAIEICDRHGEAAAVVRCTQDGVLLMPARPQNGKFHTVMHQAQTLKIGVSSNTEWKVEKENAADDWLVLGKTEFQGDDEIVLDISENKGSQVRSANLIVSTVSEGEETPVRKTVRLKQANAPIVEVHEINKLLQGPLYAGKGLKTGRYNVCINSIETGANLNVFMVYHSANVPVLEIRFHVVGGKTVPSTAPRGKEVNPDRKIYRIPIDIARPNVLGLELEKVTDAKDNEWMHVEWYLNGELLAQDTSDGIWAHDGSSDGFRVPFKEYEGGANLLLKGTGKGVNIGRWEYISPVEWGE